MRMLIARVFKLPVVEFTFGYDRYRRIARQYESGEWYVKICGSTITIDSDRDIREFKPIINCRRNGISLFNNQYEPLGEC